jgi:hypothetical protein
MAKAVVSGQRAAEYRKTPFPQVKNQERRGKSRFIPACRARIAAWSAVIATRIGLVPSYRAIVPAYNTLIWGL